MPKKIVRMTPDQLGYKDRGKMKWLGLMLSDHLDALKVMKKSRYLQQAYINKVPVIIQANTLNNGNYYPDLHCLVLGSQENKIFLLLKDNRTISCEINQIRNIEFMSIENWYNK